YVTKPFALAELMARVAAVLRRSGPAPGAAPRVARFGEIEVNLDTRTVSRAGEDVRLTHLEFELLRFLVQNPERVFSREQLLERVWGIQHKSSPRTVDNFVGQLRAKLEAQPNKPDHFITVRGNGYRFSP
ncbi:MAG: response regulator transcription factor, partial [Planctomycetes bacterium]|nr:response regulator transcription factor [Planctomycetota bacterium]